MSGGLFAIAFNQPGLLQLRLMTTLLVKQASQVPVDLTIAMDAFTRLHHRRAAHPVVDQGARRGECSLPSGHATPNSDDRRRPAVAVPRRSPVSHRRATHFIYSALSSNPHLALDVSPSRKGGQQPSISDARAENDWERG